MFHNMLTSHRIRQERWLKNDGIRSPRSQFFRQHLKMSPQKVVALRGGRYIALAAAARVGDWIICLYTEGLSHGASDFHYMVKLDLYGNVRGEVQFSELGTGEPTYNTSLLDDIMNPGDVLVMKNFRIFCFDSGIFVYLFNQLEDVTNNFVRSDDHETSWNLVDILAFGSGSVANTTAVRAPNATQTANFIVPTTGGPTARSLYQIVTFSPNQEQTVSVWLRRQVGGAQFVRLLLVDEDSSTNLIRAHFDLLNGTVHTKEQGGAGVINSTETTMEVGPDGWWLCHLCGTPNTGGTRVRATIRPTNSNSGNTYTGNGVNGFYVWRSQLATGTPHDNHPLIKTAAAAASTSGGESVTFPVAFPTHTHPISNGGFLYRAANRSPPSAPGGKSYIARSEDNGYSFPILKVIAEDGSLDFNEPGIAIMPSGAWQAILRENLGSGSPNYRTRAATPGGTWDNETSVSISESEGTQPFQLTLASDDILYTSGARTSTSGGNGGILSNGSLNRAGSNWTGINTFISEDDGETFGDKAKVALSWSTDCGQPQPIEISADRVLVIYYVRLRQYNPAEGSPPVDFEPGIFARLFTPSKLKAA